MEPSEIWQLVYEIVRKELAVPTVWLAMQAVKPLTIDGNYFVAALPPQDQYLASHLQDNQAATAIEDALHTVTGRILAFRLITGETRADWDAEKAREAADDAAWVLETTQPDIPSYAVPENAAPPKAAAPPKPPAPAAPPVSAPHSSEPPRTLSPTWEKLSERLLHGYKTAPFIKYPHGQAQYVLTSVKIISDTMDVLMPAPGAPRDEAAERALAKLIERLGSVVNLDPMFVSLELLRYRETQGKNRDIPL